jgi:hypothetical protein
VAKGPVGLLGALECHLFSLLREVALHKPDGRMKNWEDVK